MNHPRILSLPTHVANQIAAGEVVERPASVVKELLENAIDAKASKIDIDIEGGGLHLIRIRDNGIGILKEDLALAFSPHATSKIKTAACLEAILTMGFRGEALASISSVARCRLVSKPAKQESAWQIQFKENAPLITPFAHPDGTTIEVADLFYNTPVRRKFLRSEKTEFQAIEEVVKRCALAHSTITISLKHNQKLVRHYPGSTEIMGPRLSKICGNAFVENAAFLRMQAGNLTLHGWLGFPSLAKRQADCQYFFVNQRMIKDRLINHVIKTLYCEDPEMVLGTYPSYVLFLTLDPTEVDVNVHPTKQEVRFSNSRMVHDFLSKCVRDTLVAMKTQENKVHNDSFKFSYQPVPATASAAVSAKSSSSTKYNHFSPLKEKGALSALIDACEEVKPDIKPQVMMSTGKRYAFLEDDEGVLIVDLAKAKPSLTTFYFEQHVGQVPTKTLLFPLQLTLKKKIASTQQIIDSLAQYGFHILFDKNHLTLLQQPALINEVINEESLELIVEAANQHNLPKMLGQEIKLEIAADLNLLAQWVSTHPDGAYCRLTHESIEHALANQEIEFV